MSKLEVKEITPISGETDLTLGQSGGTVTLEGSVGINNNPAINSRLYVSQGEDYTLGTNYGIRIHGNGYSGGIALDGTSMQIGHGSATRSLTFHTGSGLAERMRIDADGNLLIGATEAGIYPGTVPARPYYGAKFIKSDTDSTILAVHRQASSGDVAEWGRGENKVGSISVTATATAYNTSSDYRLKEDWQPMSGSIDRLKNLKPVNFAWKVDGSRADGFLAHEVQEVVSEAIVGAKDAMRSEEYEITPAAFNDEGVETTAAVMGTREVPEYQGIDHSKLVPLLTSALQEAVAKIESLEERVAALEAN